MTVTLILWKSDNPVSIAHDLRKHPYEFVNIRSMYVGFSVRLKLVGSFIKVLRLYKSQNYSKKWF